MLLNKPLSTNVEAKKLQFEVLLAEYNTTRVVIERCRSIQSQLDIISLAGLTLAIPIVTYVIEKNLISFGAILLIPTLFFAISFMQIRYNGVVNVHAVYIHSRIRPKLENIILQLGETSAPLLEYEGFLFKAGTKNVFVFWLGTLFESGISLVIAIGLILVHFFIHINETNVSWHIYEILLVFVDTSLLLINLSYAYYIARKRHQYFKIYTEL